MAQAAKMSGAGRARWASAGRWLGFGGVLVGMVVGAFSYTGCDADFEPASKLDTLRVLAVQADHPYPRPGETVQLEMLWHDGKSPPDSPRPIQVVWLGGCFNPPGDLYYQCYQQLAKKFAALEDDPSLIEQLVGFGDTFSIDIPKEIISSRPKVEGADPYGLTYVFFAACAGEIRPAEPGDDGLPFGCFDAEGHRLGPKDYVPGYLSLYSYEDKTNANPVLYGLVINGQLIDPASEPTIPRCTSHACDDLQIKAAIDPSSAETNTGLLDAHGKTLSEQMWVEYLATDGEIASSPRLVNDASKGFNDDNGTDYTPPSEAGAQVLFAIVRDNRGGVAWVEQRVRFE